MTDFTSLRHWSLKFRNAFRGVRVGVVGQTSFYAHFLISFLVLVVATVLQVSLIEWCVLLLCMGMVMTAELINSSIECLAKAITQEHDERIRDALDMASGAVLLASIFASVVGIAIFVFRLGLALGWWAGYLLL